MKIGSNGVSAFRLGEQTPSKVYRGETQVWTNAPATPFTPVAVMLTSSTGSSYQIPAGATAMKAWAIGAGGQPSEMTGGGGGAGGVAYRQWSSITPGGTVLLTFPMSGGLGAGTSASFDNTAITGYNGDGQYGGSYTGGDGGASGGNGTQGGSPSGYGYYGGSVGAGGSQAACGRFTAADVDGLFAALALAGISTTEGCGNDAAFGSGAVAYKYYTHKSAGIGGGGNAPSGYFDIYAQPGGEGAVVLMFT